MRKDFSAQLTGPRADEWKRVLGTAEVPLRSPIQLWADKTRLSEQRAGHVYYLDLDGLNNWQRAQLAAHLAMKFDLRVSEVIEEMNISGVPIPVGDVKVVVHNPGKWFGPDGRRVRRGAPIRTLSPLQLQVWERRRVETI